MWNKKARGWHLSLNVSRGYLFRGGFRRFRRFGSLRGLRRFGGRSSFRRLRSLRCLSLRLRQAPGQPVKLAPAAVLRGDRRHVDPLFATLGHDFSASSRVALSGGQLVSDFPHLPGRSARLRAGRAVSSFELRGGGGVLFVLRSCHMFVGTFLSAGPRLIIPWTGASSYWITLFRNSGRRACVAVEACLPRAAVRM